MTTPITTFAQAITALPVATIAAQLLADMAAAGVDVVGFGTYSVQRALPELQAAAENALQNLRVTLVRAGVPTTAFMAGSDWVDVTLGGFFQEARFPASKARWLLELSTVVSGAGPYTIAVGDLVAQDDQDVTYANTDGGKILAGGTLPLAFEARVAGAAGNSAPGLISHLIVGKPGLSVTNSPPGELLLAGRDAETDAAYLVRCLGKWGIPSAGKSFEERLKSAPAYDFLIPGAAPTVTRWLVRDDNPFGPGTIGICLANAAGPATSQEVQAVVDAVTPIKPIGSGRTVVFSATPQTIHVVATLIGDGSRDGDLEADAAAVLDALTATFPIASLDSHALFRAKLIELLEQIPGMLDVELGQPQFNVPLAPYTVVQLTHTLAVA